MAEAGAREPTAEEKPSGSAKKRRRQSAATVRLSPTVMTILALIFGAIGPVTVAVQSCSQLELERQKAEAALSLEAVKQKRELRHEYMSLALSSADPKLARSETLRFLAYNFEDPDLSAWARESIAADSKRVSLAMQKEAIADRCKRSCSRAATETRNALQSTIRIDDGDCTRICVEQEISAEIEILNPERGIDLFPRCFDSCLRAAAESVGKTPDRQRQDLMSCSKICLRAPTGTHPQQSDGGAANVP